MGNKTLAGVAGAVLLTVVLGCSWFDSSTGGNSGNRPANTTRANDQNSNKSLTDKAIDTALGEQKLGVPECDEVMDTLSKFAENPDDNFVVRAGKGVLVNRIKESIRRTVEENQADKAQLAQVCKEAKLELDRYNAQQQPK